MKTRKNFEDGLCKNYLRDKRMSKLLLAGIATIASPLTIIFFFWSLVTHESNLVGITIIFSFLVDGIVYGIVFCYLFLFGSPGVESEKKRLSAKIAEKSTKRMLYEAQGKTRKAENLQKKIWEIEFDLKVIGGSVPE